jgi:CheY-like chemotaxis protein
LPEVSSDGAHSTQLGERLAGTVLVVDDEEMVRKLACSALKQCGYEVLEAGDGEDALKVLAPLTSAPSVALVDLAMPVMSGDELVPILRAKYPGMKIILSSGYPEEEARRLSQASAISGFLEKPYRVEKLAGEVARVAALE